MREYNINIPPGSGLKPNVTAIGGHNLLTNLRCGERCWNVPKALSMPFGAGQLLRGRGVTLLWKEGNEEAPEGIPVGAIEINTITQLQKIGNDPDYPMDGYYYLGNDIDASDTINWNDGDGFDPIGNLEEEINFTGTFNGNSHSIDGLFVNNLNINGSLFECNAGTLCDVRITNAIILGGYEHYNGYAYWYQGGLHMGCLCAVNRGTIERCSVTNSLVRGYIAGLLVGQTTPESVIRNCYVTGEAQGTLPIRVGGLVGENAGLIEYCYAAAKITDPFYDPEDPFSFLGGFSGINGTLEFGEYINYGVIKDCYYDSIIAEVNDFGKGTPKTTAQMKQQSTYVGWDFASVWNIDNEESYPTLGPAFNAIQDGMYIVNESTLTLTGLCNTSRSACWQMADFGEMVILTDGVRTWSFVDGEATLSSVALDAACSFDARLFYATGGVPVARYSMVGGEDIGNIVSETLTGPDGESESGGTLNAVDFAYNEDGAMLLPFRGKVLGIRRIGEAIIYYGEDGIVALTEALDMPALREIKGLPPGIGLRGCGAVDGTIDQHVFIGSDGALWMLDANLQAQRLDFAWTLDSTETVVFDPVNQEFWVGAYLLTKGGLGGPMDQVPTSIITIDGVPIATGTPYAEGQVSVLLHSGTFDMSQNGQKRVSTVNLNGDISSAQVGLLYKYDTGTTYRERGPVRCSPEGAAFLNTALVYGQLKVSGLANPEDRITRIEVRYQAHDRRFCRGTRGFQNVPEVDEDSNA